MKVLHLGKTIARKLGFSTRFASGVASAAILAVGILFAGTADAQVLFTEDFESWTLEDSGFRQSLPYDPAAVWTNTAPAGWTIDNAPEGFTPTPDGGVTEWRGWGFADINWWDNVSGQLRGDFTNSSSYAMIGDGDEWTDLPGGGTMNTKITTSPINIGGYSGDLVLNFDSSWRPYASQTGTIEVSYDNGSSWDEILLFDSTSKPNDAINENLEISLGAVGGETSMQLRFGYLNAGNDWWWAVDNLDVQDSTGSLWSEDFEGLPYGDSVDEVNPGYTENTDVIATTGQNGWVIDNSQNTYTANSANREDFDSWVIIDKDYWNVVPDAGQNRDTQFTAANNDHIAVADGDVSEQGVLNTLLVTPSIPLTSTPAITLSLDESWRPEGSSTAVIEVSYDGGNSWAQVSSRVGDETATYDPEISETRSAFSLVVPGGATEAMFRFGYMNSSNNWWWAIDNIEVSAVATNLTLQVDSDGTATFSNFTPDDAVVVGYSISSESGALRGDQLNALSDKTGYEDWVQLSDDEEAYLLGEGLLLGGTDVLGGVGGFSESLGDIWIAGPYADLKLEVLLSDGSILNADVLFDNTYKFGDFNLDGVVDEGDWPTLRDNQRGSFAGMSQAESYVFGDMDGDGDNDFQDFSLFKQAFDSDQGAGAFAAFLSDQANVPEPSSVLLVTAFAGVGILGLRRRK
ncbi:PEP-CTERM sorting domain-containing protein [Aeoliella mucimassa]|uniref:PEP-CTERM protein-sorting domain-containing protein n=1 Tax=Aeoliella mucimassa TaxID=2527972 RepID=A0A518AUX8_9BACT|nr:PEP-CTERM sorting domain-containing protein [Aeoliella mucimassa]QDU58512.1 hypothetical protein Pan181_47500 [Aeoliella mucimassa]